jgi:hypothetical protein
MAGLWLLPRAFPKWYFFLSFLGRLYQLSQGYRGAMLTIATHPAQCQLHRVVILRVRHDPVSFDNPVLNSENRIVMHSGFPTLVLTMVASIHHLLPPTP